MCSCNTDCTFHSCVFSQRCLTSVLVLRDCVASLAKLIRITCQLGMGKTSYKVSKFAFVKLFF